MCYRAKDERWIQRDQVKVWMLGSHKVPRRSFGQRLQVERSAING
jgi:hypothetical protein